MNKYLIIYSTHQPIKVGYSIGLGNINQNMMFIFSEEAIANSKGEAVEIFQNDCEEFNYKAKILEIKEI